MKNQWLAGRWNKNRGKEEYTGRRQTPVDNSRRRCDGHKPGKPAAPAVRDRHGRPDPLRTALPAPEEDARGARRFRVLDRRAEAAALTAGGPSAVTMWANRHAGLPEIYPEVAPGKKTRDTAADEAGLEKPQDCRPAGRGACSARRKAFNRAVDAPRKTRPGAANPIVCGRGPRFRPPRQRYDL